MSNTTSISVDTVASDLSEFTIVDGTTFTDPLRADCGVFLTVQKMSADATVAETLTITSDTDDPNDAAEWTVPYTEGDGYYRACYVSAPDYDGADTYEIYDLVFEPGTGKAWRSKQNANTGNALAAGSWWEEITGTNIGLISLNEGESNESANIDSTTFEFIMTAYAEQSYATQIATASEQYLTSTIIPDDVLDTYVLLQVLLNGAYVASDRANYPQGERILDRFTSITESLS